MLDQFNNRFKKSSSLGIVKPFFFCHGENFSGCRSEIIKFVKPFQ